MLGRGLKEGPLEGMVGESTRELEAWWGQGTHRHWLCVHSPSCSSLQALLHMACLSAYTYVCTRSAPHGPSHTYADLKDRTDTWAHTHTLPRPKHWVTIDLLSSLPYSPKTFRKGT